MLSAQRVLTLSEILARSLLHNPTLQADGWEVRAREAAALQAGLWPNPEIGADIEEFAGNGERTGTRRAEIGLGLSQVIPLGGDIRARRRVATLEGALAGWDYETTRLDVLTDATQSFVAVLAAQRRLMLADDLLALARQFAGTVADRAEAGKVSPLEATRADVVRANAQIARTQAVHELETARTRLAGLWGMAEPDFEVVAGDLGSVAPIPAFRDVANYVGENPDVARWVTEIALRHATLLQSKAERIPDPTLTVGPSRFNEFGETALRAGISIPLPVFDRSQGAVQEARYRIRRAESGAQAAFVEARRLLAETYGSLAAAYASATTLEKEVLPAAADTYEAVQEGYREGKFDLLTVLDAQRTLFEATNRHIDAMLTYHQSRAAVERLVGTQLNTIETQ